MPPDEAPGEARPQEIERKFLVTGDDWRSEVRGQKNIRQAYLALTDAAQVRVRIVDDGQASLTIKSADPKQARAEFEYEVPAEEAEAMLELRAGAVLEKTRFLVPTDGDREWEIDVFGGSLEGLVLAEIELGKKDEEITVPGWCGREVTGDARFYNAELSKADAPPEIE